MHDHRSTQSPKNDHAKPDTVHTEDEELLRTGHQATPSVKPLNPLPLPGRSNPEQILNLQRVIGNKATHKLLSQSKLPGQPSPKERKTPVLLESIQNTQKSLISRQSQRDAQQTAPAQPETAPTVGAQGQMVGVAPQTGTNQLPPNADVTVIMDQIENTIREIYDERIAAVTALEGQMSAPQPTPISDQILLNLATLALSMVTSGLGSLIVNGVVAALPALGPRPSVPQTPTQRPPSRAEFASMGPNHGDRTNFGRERRRHQQPRSPGPSNRTDHPSFDSLRPDEVDQAAFAQEPAASGSPQREQVTSEVVSGIATTVNNAVNNVLPGATVSTVQQVRGESAHQPSPTNQPRGAMTPLLVFANLQRKLLRDTRLAHLNAFVASRPQLQAAPDGAAQARILRQAAERARQAAFELQWQRTLAAFLNIHSMSNATRGGVWTSSSVISGGVDVTSPGVLGLEISIPNPYRGTGVTILRAHLQGVTQEVRDHLATQNIRIRDFPITVRVNGIARSPSQGFFGPGDVLMLPTDINMELTPERDVHFQRSSGLVIFLAERSRLRGGEDPDVVRQTPRHPFRDTYAQMEARHILMEEIGNLTFNSPRLGTIPD